MSTEPGRNQWQPGKLWSLWDIMQSFDAGRLPGALAGLSRWKVETANVKFPASMVPAPPIHFARQVTTSLRRDVDLALRELLLADCPLSAGIARQLLDILDKDEGFQVPKELDSAGGWSSDKMFSVTRHIEELCLFVPRELSSKLVLTVTPQGAGLILEVEPFGPTFARQFPSLSYEATEAAKCLGLERSTAAVFHSIRMLEAGIAALSRCLGIPDPTKASERTWGKLLEALRKQIDAVWPARTGRSSGDGQFFEELYGTLAGLQNPYRNSTMHLDAKYTEEEAREVYVMVRGFMRRLAERIDENGSPKISP